MSIHHSETGNAWPPSVPTPPPNTAREANCEPPHDIAPVVRAPKTTKLARKTPRQERALRRRANRRQRHQWKQRYAPVLRIASWWRDPLRLKRLRGHPEFDLSPSTREGGAAPKGVLSLESGREAAFARELVRLYRERLRLVATIGLLMVPLFLLFYALLSRPAAEAILLPHLGLMALEVGVLWSAKRTHDVRGLRVLTLGTYAVFCTVTAGVALRLGALATMTTTGDGARAVEFAALAAHSAIMISVLLLPMVLWEGTLVSAFVTGSLALSLWKSGVGTREMHLAQLFVLEMSSLLVLSIVYLQNIMRCAAFDAAFDLAQTASQMKAQSVRDELTGGFNRRHLEELLDAELARATRFGHPLSLIIFDLDGFKAVNDSRGHVRGDEVLREVVAAAGESVREVDTVARFGGDEFCVVLPETDASAAFRVAERLRIYASARLRRKWPDGPESQVTLSIGVVTSQPESEILSVRDLFARADERLYVAKRLGKNRVVR